jgi:hypothetical protein
MAPRKKPAAIGAKAPFPGFIEPALATSIEKVPTGERWVHEIKFDGYRVQLHIANDAAKVFTRNGHDWTNRFNKIAHDAFLISASSAIIDGEVVVPAADGTTDFSILQNELKGRSTKIVMVAFLGVLRKRERKLSSVPEMKPMASFDPSQPAILHDRFTDKIETWTGEDADDYRENAMVDGTVEWRGFVFDGWGDVLVG